MVAGEAAGSDELVDWKITRPALAGWAPAMCPALYFTLVRVGNSLKPLHDVDSTGIPVLWFGNRDSARSGFLKVTQQVGGCARTWTQINPLS